MANGPKHLIGEAEIIFLIIPGSHRDCGHGDVGLDRFRYSGRGSLLDNISIPSEPDAANRPDGIAEGYRQPSRLDLIFQVRHTVRDNDQTGQTNASQGFDKRVAPLIIPTME